MTLIDENVEPIDFERLARADIVGLTGMSVQRDRMREILTRAESARRLHRRRRPVGHACRRTTSTTWPTSIFVGEAEETWPRSSTNGQRAGISRRYEQAEKTDMTQRAGAALRSAEDAALPVRQRAVLARLSVPVRVLRHHRHVRPPAAAQDERRRSSPSSKPCARRSVEIVFIVDDNLIGNKKAIKELLRDLIAWQRQHGYPLTFFTEASLDLAEDDELMRADGRRRTSSPSSSASRARTRSRCARRRSTRTSARARRSSSGSATIQDAGHGSLVRHDRRLRQRRRRRSSTRSASSSARRPHPARHDRHALGDSQDAAVRPAGRRGPARSRRRTGVRHQRHSARHEPRRAARRLRATDAGPLRARASTSSASKISSSQGNSIGLALAMPTGANTRGGS